MKTLEVYDPALSYFDPALVQFAADLKWLETQGVKIARHRLGAKQSAAAVADAEVAAALAGGNARPPFIVVDGRVVHAGTYPGRGLLAQLLGIAAEDTPLETAGCCCKPWIGGR